MSAEFPHTHRFGTWWKTSKLSESGWPYRVALALSLLDHPFCKTLSWLSAMSGLFPSQFIRYDYRLDLLLVHTRLLLEFSDTS